MRIEILFGTSTLRRWHGDLIRRLRELPQVEVGVRRTNAVPTRADRHLEKLLRLERALYGLDGGELGRVSIDPGPDRTGESAVVIDLTESPRERHWRVLYDGSSGERAAVDALRSGRLPVVTIVDGRGEVRAIGRPGSEQPGLFATALADVGAGVATLVIGAVTGGRFASPHLSDNEEEAGPTGSNSTAPRSQTPPSFARIAARRIVGAAVRFAYRGLFRAPHWRVGWRRVVGPDSFSLSTLPTSGWHDIPDDGHRFYADPFLFEHEGSTYLFVEDFIHDEGKAVISAVEWGDQGPMGTPRPVLEHSVHLSYPCVFGHAGEVWMIPETSNAKTVELYRATNFPWNWEFHSVLLEGLTVSDATPFQHEGRWWMTATVGYGGSLSDSLCLWSAPQIWGPWTPHARNPVLIDIASARPAGHVEVRDGRLLRPVQDCRGGYGAAMGVAEITRLDDEGFEQLMGIHHRAGVGWPGTRVHTLNSAHGFEVIDGSSFAPRFWSRRHGTNKNVGLR